MDGGRKEVQWRVGWAVGMELVDGGAALATIHVVPCTCKEV